MKYFDWDNQKNKRLKTERDISFEDCLVAINEGKLLATIDHTDKKKYPHQKIFIINISNYVYLVPFVEDEEKIFLKTIIPSRKFTKKYILKIKDPGK
ncbi:MAG: toxin [Patescibacteria group bacterium]